jgi:predicted small integral membrane protein
MAMEVFEFVSPAVDTYRCCIQSNTTGQDLFVRLIGLTGVQLAAIQTGVNGNGCTAFIGLGAGFAFQCTVASGAGSPVGAAAHYVLGACRQ